jgi:transcription-repair coupling factor (superfamily II helicase)
MNLFEIMSVKLVAKKAMVARIDGGRDVVNITFAEGANISPERIILLLKKNKGKIRLVQEFTLQVTLDDQSLRTAADAVKKYLQELM